MGVSFVRVYKANCNRLFLDNMVNENLVKDVVKEPYKYGFVTDIETEKIEKGLNEDIICLLYTSPSPRDVSSSRMPSSA